jgi:hypothetical protein
MNPLLNGECTVYPVFGAEMYVTGIKGLFECSAYSHLLWCC